MEEQVKTTKRKRKPKKDDGIDLANVCSDTVIICVVQYSLVYEGFSKRCCKKVIMFAWIFTDQYFVQCFVRMYQLFVQ